MQRSGPQQRRQRRSEDPAWSKFFDEAQIAAAKQQEVLEMSLADCGLPVRIVNNLEAHKILQVQQLLRLSRETLIAMGNFGENNLQECAAMADRLALAHPAWTKPIVSKKRKKGSSKKKGATPVVPRSSVDLPGQLILPFQSTGTTTGRFSSQQPNLSSPGSSLRWSAAHPPVANISPEKPASPEEQLWATYFDGLTPP